MVDPALAVAVAGLGLIAYALLRWRLMVATQDFRVRAACAADDLIAGGTLGPRDERVLAWAVVHAFDGRLPWLTLLSALMSTFKSPRRGLQDYHAMMPAQRRALSLFGRLLVASLATSPLAALLTGVVVALTVLARGTMLPLTILASVARDRAADDDHLAKA